LRRRFARYFFTAKGAKNAKGAKEKQFLLFLGVLCALCALAVKISVTEPMPSAGRAAFSARGGNR
jgi:hypothetical protein